MYNTNRQTVELLGMLTRSAAGTTPSKTQPHSTLGEVTTLTLDLSRYLSCYLLALHWLSQNPKPNTLFADKAKPYLLYGIFSLPSKTQSIVYLVYRHLSCFSLILGVNEIRPVICWKGAFISCLPSESNRKCNISRDKLFYSVLVAEIYRDKVNLNVQDVIQNLNYVVWIQ